MSLKLLGDAEKRYGKDKFTVWISKVKFSILRPPYALEEVAKFLDMDIHDYVEKYREVNSWIQQEGERRGLIEAYDA